MSRAPEMLRSRSSGRELIWLIGVAIVAVAPAPLGSHRPIFWALNAMMVSALAALYILRSPSGRRFDVPLSHIAVPMCLWLATLAWAVVQLAPIGTEGVHAAVWRDATDALGQALPTRISVDPAATIYAIIRMATYGLLFFLMLQATASRRLARRTVTAVFWIAFAYSTYALAALYMGDRVLFMQKWAYSGFATGPFVNRNSFATFAAFGLALGIVLIFSEGTRRTRTKLEAWLMICVFGAASALVLLSLLLSGSRMGALAAAAGTAFACFSYGWRSRPLPTLGIAALVGLAVISTAAFGDLTLDRFSWHDDARIRLELYSDVVEMISTRPLTGYGAGAFSSAFPLFHSSALSPDVVWDAAHNTYLQLLAELGAVGVFPVAAVGILAMSNWASFLRRGGTAEIASACLCVVAGVHSVADFSMQIQANAFVVLAVLAAGTAARLQRAHAKGASRTPGMRVTPEAVA